MIKHKALYGRQSVDKKDSISIETQLKFGKNLCDMNKWKYKEYFDKGFSGSNLDRPDFKKLINDVKSGVIDTVICYRLDRISRSLVDFANLLEMFKQYNVEFISVTENFDTSTPIGRAMINIIMVFAQLERETIQQRISDNYYARAKNGSFVGGSISYGYISEKVLINNKKVSVLKPVDVKLEEVKEIFSLYLQNKSINYIAKFITKKTDKLIINKKIKHILVNPIYVKADSSIYEYYKLKGYNIHNKIDEFNCERGLIIYGKEKGKLNRIYTDISEQIIILVNNTPIINPKDFLNVQDKLETNKRNCTAKKSGKHTWLTGILKCKDCGCSIGAKISKGHKYMLCSKFRLYNACTNSKTYKIDELESVIYTKIKKYLNSSNLDDLNVKKFDLTLDEKENKLNIERISLKEKLDNFVNAIGCGTKLNTILENNIIDLDNKIKLIDKEILEIKSINTYNNNIDIELYKKSIDLFLTKFNDLDIEDRSSLVKNLVKEIRLNDKDLIITYNF